MKKTATDLKLSALFSLLCLAGIASGFIGTDRGTTPNITIAYLDPGTGTMIISAIVGILATVALGVKTFWYKLVHIFKPGSKKNDSANSDNTK